MIVVGGESGNGLLDDVQVGLCSLVPILYVSNIVARILAKWHSNSI